MKVSLLIFTFFLAGGPTWAAAGAKPSLEAAFQDAREGRKAELQKKMAKLEINAKNAQGSTLLMAAASAGQDDIVQLLLDQKADPNITDTDGSTALLIAIYNEQTPSATKLIAAGTRLDVFNNLGESALIAATSTNNIEVIKALLAKDKSQINKTNKDHENALMKAAAVGSLQTVQLLVNAGADLKAKDHLGRTAYDIAKESQNTDSLKLLKPKK